MIKLVAPEIVFEGGAILDVSGGGGENGGVIFLQGMQVGTFIKIGVSNDGLCTSDE